MQASRQEQAVTRLRDLLDQVFRQNHSQLSLMSNFILVKVLVRLPNPLAPGSCQLGSLTTSTKHSIILVTLSDRDIQEGSRGREEKLKLKERERRVQELEGRLDFVFIVMTIVSDNNIILGVVIIAIIIIMIIQVERRPADGENQRCGTQPAGSQ